MLGEMMRKMRDQNLAYEAALHGVQSAIKYELMQKHPGMPGEAVDLIKHLRVGIDAQKAEFAALAYLLIDKGVFTADEYIEAMRLGMNEELARYTEHCRHEYGLPPGAEFR